MNVKKKSTQTLNKEKRPIKWKYFIFFYLVQIILITVVHWIAKDVNKDTSEMFYVNISALIIPPVICILMLLNYKAEYRLSFLQKFIALIGLLAINFVSIIVINLFNPFNRDISPPDIFEGIITTGVYVLILLIVCLPIVGLIKTRKQEK